MAKNIRFAHFVETEIAKVSDFLAFKAENSASSAVIAFVVC